MILFFRLRLRLLKNNFHRGMVLPLVLTICFILVMFLMMVINWTSQNRNISFQNITRMKAKSVAMGGIQHALLKMKLMPNAAYDAVSLSQIRNPFFDYRSGLIHGGGTTLAIQPNPREPNYCPGPVYLAPSQAALDSMIQTYSTNGILDKYLDFFREDIRYADAGSWRQDPYPHTYTVDFLKVLAIKDAQRYGRETIELQVTGVIEDFMGYNRSVEIRKVIEISRREALIN